MARDMTLDLSPFEASALMVMLNEAIEMHFHPHSGDGFDLKSWEHFDLDGIRLIAYYKFRTVYEKQYPFEEK